VTEALALFFKALVEQAAHEFCMDSRNWSGLPDGPSWTAAAELRGALWEELEEQTGWRPRIELVS
jgi:hypothetical protein